MLKNDTRELKAAWVKFLVSYPWTHFCHLTFAFDLSPELAFRRLRSFRDSLTAQVQGPLPYVAVAEPTYRGRPHLHVLLAGAEVLPAKQLEARWRRNGFARVRGFDLSRTNEAVGYVFKHVERSDTHVEVSDGFSSGMRRLNGRTAKLSS